jgi:hypothetical protein
MSLRPLNALNPLGQFDCVDGELASFKGGEVCTFATVTTSAQPGVTSSTDQAAYDVFDGYVQTTTTLGRPAVSKNFSVSGAPQVLATSRPLMLSDDGITGYGSLLGSVIGGTVGQGGATALGPSSATGSGKMTCWSQSGIFAVSLDACDTTTTTGLNPTNTTLTVGAPLKFTTAGLLAASGNGTNLAASAPVVATLIEFATNGSLVNTPNYLTQALNSPTGSTAASSLRKFTYAVIAFNPPTANG